MTTNKKAVAYYRVSTAKQGASGLGLDAQREGITRHLLGGAWELIGEYTDIESGTSKGNTRPELAKALAHAKRERATLIIAKLDRLSRNVHFISGLLESKVEFIAVDNPGANRLTVHVLAAVAEAEAEAISKRTREALAAARARGVVLGMPGNLDDQARRQGAQVQREHAVTAYASLVHRVLNLKQRGMSYRAIAAALNADGEVTRTGRPFVAQTVKRVLERVARQ